MPPTPPIPSPSQQVERIREILVGRQMQSVEQRLNRLEQQLQPMPVAGTGDLDELRAEQKEAFTRIRDELDGEKLRQLEETRRLSLQIQSIARQRREIAEEARLSVIDALKPGFERWQQSFLRYLDERESQLSKTVEDRIESLRSELKSPATPLDQPGVRQAIQEFAGAARRLSEALTPQEAR